MGACESTVKVAELDQGRTKIPIGRFAVVAMLSMALSTSKASAHEPLFMMSHEAPGKGASDVHLAVHGERGENEDETEFELEYTRGLTRNVALKISTALVRREERVLDLIEGSTGIGDPSIRMKWRFWDRDVLAAKYAVAAMIQSTIPVGEGGGRLGSERPAILAGLSHGRESLEWYYFADIRYLRRVADAGTKSGDRLFMDASVGWRPYLAGLEETDAVLFLEFNYAHAFEREVDGATVRDTAADYLFLAPEILLSPTNRLMFKAGLQIPLVQAVKSPEMEAHTTFVLETEIRF